MLHNFSARFIGFFAFIQKHLALSHFVNFALTIPSAWKYLPQIFTGLNPLFFQVFVQMPPKSSIITVFQSVQSLRLFATPGTAVRQASPSITNSWSLLKLMSIESVMPSNHFILCCPLLLHLQSFSASGSFQMSQLLASGSKSIGVSASASVLPMNTQD